jgi:hypothetical protein
MKTLTFARLMHACLAGGAILSLTAAGYGPPRPTLPQARAIAHGRIRAATDCTTKGSNAFIGGGTGNTAAGADAAVVAGENNTACNQLSVIAGGEQNKIFQTGAPQNAEDSFIGAGDSNDIGSYGSFIGAGEDGIVGDYDAFIGAGYANLADKRYAFTGAGALNDAGGIASVVAGGGGEYYETQEADGNQMLSFGNVSGGEDSFVGAGDLNRITGNGSFIGAGDWTYALNSATTAGNQISGTDSFIGTGDQNTVSGSEAFVGAGNQNTASATEDFIGSGDQNVIKAPEAFIGSGGINSIASTASYASILGGNRNSVAGEYASILGGYGSTANGTYAIVAGGDGNAATGTLSFVAGYRATAGHSGSFVWSDYTSGSAALKDTANNQFVARASGGTTFYSNEAMTNGVTLAAGGGTWASLSDRNAKTTIVPADDDGILARVATLPVSTWQYASERGVRHVGPMAQDFYAAFGVGADDRHITSIDEDGVALASIKALDGELHRENAGLRTRVAALESKVSEIDALRRELRRLEAKT